MEEKLKAEIVSEALAKRMARPVCKGFRGLI